MLINIETQEQVGEYQFRLLHPNVSFPVELTDAVLSSFGFANLQYPAPPIASAGKKIVSGGVEKIDNKWFARYVEVDLEDEELQAYAEGVRAERNRLLSQSDWTQVSDAPVNKAVWATYRQALRDITAQTGFPLAVVWPNPPQE